MKDYATLFSERKWKEAFAVMPLNVPKVVQVNVPSDLRTIPVRASEFTRDEATDRKISVSVDLIQHLVIITATKKESQSNTP